MFQNGLPGILLLIRWCKSTCLQITPGWFFQHSSKTMPSKAGSVVSESKYHLFHIPRFSATVFFSYLSYSMCVSDSMCVFQLSRTNKLPEVPDKPRIDVKRCFFPRFVVVGIDATPNSSNHHGPWCCSALKKHGSRLIGKWSSTKIMLRMQWGQTKHK